jgi:hypothetical protein
MLAHSGRAERKRKRDLRGTVLSLPPGLGGSQRVVVIAAVASVWVVEGGRIRFVVVGRREIVDEAVGGVVHTVIMMSLLLLLLLLVM